MSLRTFVVAVVLLSGALASVGGCSGDGGGRSGDGGGGSDDGSCDSTKKGFVNCGPTPDIFTICQPGTFCQEPNTQSCSAGCASDVNCGCGESCVSGSCIKSSVCGDGSCNGNETASSCPADCKASPCSNGVCDAGETLQTCPLDCQGNPCGNGICDPGEMPQTCPMDCTPMPCGDSFCDGNETFQTCATDCGQQKMQCDGLCESYDFFGCFAPGDLQICYDACAAATGPMLTQFNNCASTATAECDLSCFDFL